MLNYEFGEDMCGSAQDKCDDLTKSVEADPDENWLYWTILIAIVDVLDETFPVALGQRLKNLGDGDFLSYWEIQRFLSFVDYFSQTGEKAN